MKFRFARVELLMQQNKCKASGRDLKEIIKADSDSDRRTCVLSYLASFIERPSKGQL